MIITRTLSEFYNAYNNLENKDSVGFIPTMGALHAGHISLVKNSATKCAHTISSVFVNPTQFNNPNDLESYPRTLEADANLLEQNGVDILFAPTVDEVYPEADERVFNLGGLDKFGEGPRRPGHFNGVAQVVTRLFDIVKPTHAFFGEKDFQQEAIIKHFTKELGYNIEIVGCPILREEDGLAMSSRNRLLTAQQREAAPHIYKTICKATEYMESNTPKEVISLLTDEINANSQLESEYIEIVDAEKLTPINSWDEASSIRLWCAIYAHPVRLIDNIKLK